MGIFSTAKINRLLVGESLVGDGNEVAHIDLIIGPRGSPAESAFARALPLHMVSAWGCEQRLVLAQIATDAKSNEITAVPQLLKLLSLEGTIVTVDALNCQRTIAQQIIDQHTCIHQVLIEFAQLRGGAKNASMSMWRILRCCMAPVSPRATIIKASSCKGR